MGSLEMHHEFLDSADKGENNPAQANTDIPDGFGLINPDFKELSFTCSNGKFVTWIIGEEGGKPKIEKKPNARNSSENTYYCSSFDRESLWAYRTIKKEVYIDFHSKS